MSTFGKTGGFTGKALSSVDSAVEPVAFHSSAKFSVCVGDEELEGVAVGVAVGVEVGVEVGVGTGFLIVTPLSHTDFVPDLIQVYFLPRCIFVMPFFEQVDPAFGGVAEYAGAREIVRKRERPRIPFFMY